MASEHQHRGFTLVEIAIVLVIIGLVIGGFLKGQEMLTSARVSRMEGDYRSVAAAILTYQERYNVMPGDDPAASRRFPGTWSEADDGNGNGRVEGAWNSSSNAEESRKLWKHLRGAGLIKGPVDQSPASYQPPVHAWGGPMGFGQRLYNLDHNVIVFGAVPGDVARVLESRGDDGRPSAGTIQGSATQSAYDVNTTYDLAFRF